MINIILLRKIINLKRLLKWVSAIQRNNNGKHIIKASERSGEIKRKIDKVQLFTNKKVFINQVLLQKYKILFERNYIHQYKIW
jgi:hypothetical protein